MTSPRAVQFEPSDGTASPDIEALLEGPDAAGPVVLLAVGPAAQRSGWAAQAAIALADAFAARGDDVILADLSLEQPELHTALGVSNDEGLTDVFLFGASLEHTATRVPGKLFRLMPASQFTPDAAEVLQHANWGGLFEALAIAKRKLIAYLPIEVPGASALSDRIGHTVVLASEDEITQIEDALSADADVICMLAPPGPKAPPEPPPHAEAEAVELAREAEAPSLERLDDRDFEKIRIPRDGARDALIADLRKRQRDALMAPPPAMAPLPDEAATTVPAPAPKPQAVRPTPRTPRKPVESISEPLFMVARQRQPKRPRAWMTWMLLLILLAAAGAGGWYFWETRSATTPPPLVRTPPPAAQQPAPAVAATPGTKLPYSVAIASYPLLQTATEQLAQLRRQGDIAFYIAPLILQGKVFYRVMAGPVADTTSANALRDTLIAKRIKTITSGWDVVSTPYAFLIGEYPSRGAAEAARDAAEKKTVPAYVIPVATAGGSTSYRLYAGAFTGPGDADFMRTILKSAGYTDNLVERTGSIS